MLNGFLGGHDAPAPGWQGCGYACETTAAPGRTYESLRLRR